MRLWDLRSGSSQVIASHPVYIEAVDRCGHSVVSGSLDGTATLTDLRMLPGAQSLQPSLTPQQHPQQGAVATWRTAPIMELQYVNEGRIVSAHANPNIVQVRCPAFHSVLSKCLISLLFPRVSMVASAKH